MLGALVFSILIPLVIDIRQSPRPARQNFGQELLRLHVAFGEALLRFARTPEGAPRVRAADAVDNAYRAGGFKDARWRVEMIDEFASAFDVTHGRA